MKALVFGTTGQVATELMRQAPEGTDIVALGRAQADLSDPAACAAAVAGRPADVVINAAAYTAVDRAEDEEDLARVINAEAPGAMARACADLGVPLVQISTEYVFDGAGDTPWTPDAPTGPLGAYGRSKLAGEVAVRAAAGRHAILRTSWVVSAHGSNFVKTMLRLGRERDELSIVADQTGGPTPARDLARACLLIAGGLLDDPARSGTYHFAGAPDVSWADFARAIFDMAGITCAVTDIPTSAYPTAAARPLNSRMDCSALETDFGVSRPDWRAGLRDILKDLGEI